MKLVVKDQLSAGEGGEAVAVDEEDRHVVPVAQDEVAVQAHAEDQSPENHESPNRKRHSASARNSSERRQYRERNPQAETFSNQPRLLYPLKSLSRRRIAEILSGLEEPSM